MTQRQYLTQSEWDHTQSLLLNNDRSGAYAYVRDITGNTVTVTDTSCTCRRFRLQTTPGI